MRIKCLECRSPEVELTTNLEVKFKFNAEGDVELITDVNDEIYFGVEYGELKAVCKCSKCGNQFSYDDWKESLKKIKAFEFNKDVELRDEIIFGRYELRAYKGQVRRFEKLSLEKLKQLVELKFINLEECQNDSPTTREFIEFMEKYSGYTVEGYAVSIDRDDYRVTIDGVGKVDKENASCEEIDDFIDYFGNAEEFEIYGSLYAWFD